MSLLNIKSNDSFFQREISDFVSLFFPESCLGCLSGLVKGEDILCTSCLLNLPKTNYISCEGNPVQEKFIGRLPLKHAWAFLRFRKSGVVQQLLHQLKYKNRPEIGEKLGRIAATEFIKNNIKIDFDLIIPIPLHAQRQRNRGYNQSAKFAEGLGNTLGIQYNERICRRLTNTKTQTKKTREERWENVENVFKIIDVRAVEAKRILLVDDVITTGATLEACGRQLLNAGCKELSIGCIAEAQ